jgi:D-glycero-alpha-D-manno-heptose-7-phosphate kinase
MIISRTPYRISFFGGGTDFPAWYRDHGGAVLATTINKYCYITLRYLPPFFEHRSRIVYSKIEMCQTLDEILHPSVREVLRYYGVPDGVEIHHDGDLPARSGLGTSSSFTVGLANAVAALLGRMPNKAQLARDSIYIEQERLRETVGCQDQVLAAYGGLNHVIFNSNGEISVRPMTLSRARVAELNSHLMLFFTGISRSSSEIAATYVQDIGKREGQLRRFGEMVEEGLGILTSGNDLVEFGRLLHEAWQAKQSLSPAVATPAVRDLYDAAVSAGAIGGKLTGAGGGGFLLLFVRPGDHARVRERLSKLTHVPFRFEFSGSQIIFFDPEEDFAAYAR